MSLLKRLSAYLIRLGLALLILVALLVSVLRFVQPLANDFRDELAQVLSQRLGYQVSIGALRLSSAGLAPRLTLERVRLSRPDDGAVALSLRAMELDLNVPATVRTRAPQFEAFTLIGARLVVERSADGRLRILGLGGLRSDDPKALELFLGQGELNLAKSEILYIDRSRGGKLARLTDLRLSLRNTGGRHSMNLRARLVPPDPIASGADGSDTGAGDEKSSSNALHLAAVLKGPPADPWSWTGRIYAKLDVGNLGLLLRTQALGLGPIDTRSLALETWQQIDHGRLVQGVASLDLAGLQATLPARLSAGGAGSASFGIDRLRVLARLRPESAGWQLQLGDMELQMNGADLAGLDLDVRLTQDWRLAGLGATLSELNLEETAAALSTGPWRLPDRVREVLDRKPSGWVHDLALGLAPSVDPDASGWRWQASAELSGLGLEQRGSIPGLQGLDVRVSVTQDGGTLRLGSRQMTLDLNPLFSLPIPLTRLGGQLDWARRSEGGWRLNARQIELANADLSGRGHLRLDLPADGSSPFLDLRASFKDANAAHTRRYLPVGVMDPALVSWLEDAIQSGRVTQGDAIFRGALADYPFRERQGRFELLLKFEDLLLDYQKGWPPIEGGAGSLHFLNQALSIRVDRGRIYDSAFSNGRAELPELWGAQSMRIHGEAQGPFVDGLRALKETPLAQELGQLAKVLDVTGESRLALDIDLPFQKHHKIGVDGHLTWPAAATLGVAGTPLVLSDLTGELDFTERSLKAKAIGAKLWGRPLKLSIGTEGEGNPETSITRIEARSETALKTLSGRLPSGLWRLADGQLDWVLAVILHNRDVSEQNLPLDFELSSSLRGVALDLPAPLGKSAKSSRDLRLGGTLVPGSSLSLVGYLGDLGANLKLRLGSGGARLIGGRLRLGDRSPPPPDPGKLQLDGSLDELDLSPWIQWAGSGPLGRALGRDDGGSADGLRLGLDLDCGRLRLGGIALTDATLEADPDQGGWQLGVRADELAGRLYVAGKDDTRPLGINLERLDLKALSANLSASGSGKTGTVQLDQLPSLDLRAAELHWGDALLGSLDVALRKDASGIRIPRVKLAGPGLMTIDGNGGWTRGKDGGDSQVDLRLGTQDLGRLLAALSEKTVLEAKDASAQLQLSWPGSLTDFALQRSKGAIDLQVAQGRFLEVEPGVGRLLGFLNFAALGRRLALDFSDLYGQGFAFEQVRGKVEIGQGKASFQDFVIDGPAGKVMVEGSTDLATERLDQTVTVEPKVGSSVALASAVAGGPVVGAAVYLVDRVAGNPIDRLVRYQYKMTGSWGQPELTRMGWEPLARQRKPGESSGKGAKDEKDEKPKNLFLDID